MQVTQTERIELINVERTTQELRPTKRNSLSPSLKVAARVYLDEKLGNGFFILLVFFNEPEPNKYYISLLQTIFDEFL
ncbi:hypothetical protein AAG906_009403 [Vitis piasezkii]